MIELFCDPFLDKDGPVLCVRTHMYTEVITEEL